MAANYNLFDSENILNILKRITIQSTHGILPTSLDKAILEEQTRKSLGLQLALALGYEGDKRKLVSKYFAFLIEKGYIQLKRPEKGFKKLSQELPIYYLPETSVREAFEEFKKLYPEAEQIEELSNLPKLAISAEYVKEVEKKLKEAFYKHNTTSASVRKSIQQVEQTQTPNLAKIANRDKWRIYSLIGSQTGGNVPRAYKFNQQITKAVKSQGRLPLLSEVLEPAKYAFIPKTLTIYTQPHQVTALQHQFGIHLFRYGARMAALQKQLPENVNDFLKLLITEPEKAIDLLKRDRTLFKYASILQKYAQFGPLLEQKQWGFGLQLLLHQIQHPANEEIKKKQLSIISSASEKIQTQTQTNLQKLLQASPEELEQLLQKQPELKYYAKLINPELVKKLETKQFTEQLEMLRRAQREGPSIIAEQLYPQRFASFLQQGYDAALFSTPEQKRLFELAYQGKISTEGFFTSLEKLVEAKEIRLPLPSLADIYSQVQFEENLAEKYGLTREYLPILQKTLGATQEEQRRLNKEQLKLFGLTEKHLPPELRRFAQVEQDIDQFRQMLKEAVRLQSEQDLFSKKFKTLLMKSAYQSGLPFEAINRGDLEVKAAALYLQRLYMTNIYPPTVKITNPEYMDISLRVQDQLDKFNEEFIASNQKIMKVALSAAQAPIFEISSPVTEIGEHVRRLENLSTLLSRTALDQTRLLQPPKIQPVRQITTELMPYNPQSFVIPKPKSVLKEVTRQTSEQITETIEEQTAKQTAREITETAKQTKPAILSEILGIQTTKEAAEQAAEQAPTAQQRGIKWGFKEVFDEFSRWLMKDNMRNLKVGGQIGAALIGISLIGKAVRHHQQKSIQSVKSQMYYGLMQQPQAVNPYVGSSVYMGLYQYQPQTLNYGYSDAERIYGIPQIGYTQRQGY